jgi:hypothetical protein
MSTRLSVVLSLIVILLIALLCAGCGQTDEPPAPTATSSEESSAPSETALDSPIPTPVVTELDLDAAPEPGKANLRGRIVITEQTALLGELYLAAAVPTSDPEIYLLELDDENSPRALLDRNTWNFLFQNVEPGKYGLIAWEPLQSSPISDSETGETLFIDLAADEVHDIGVLYFPHP